MPRDAAAHTLSPQRRHALVQQALTIRIGDWARGRGEVGPEWRFRLTPPGQETQSVVPDLAFVSLARESGYAAEDLESPTFAPDVAFEVRSCDDVPDEIDHNVSVLLACGSNAVIVVDPEARSIDAHDANGTTSFTADACFTHASLPGLTFTPEELFAILDHHR
jgi:Uma2 family endonuclease